MRSVLNFSLLPLDLLIVIALDCLFATLFFGLFFGPLFFLSILLLERELLLISPLPLGIGFDFIFFLLSLVFTCLLINGLEDNLLVFIDLFGKQTTYRSPLTLHLTIYRFIISTSEFILYNCGCRFCGCRFCTLALVYDKELR